MFSSMFSFSRYGHSYGHDSSEDDEPSSAFQLRRSEHGEGEGNVALARALAEADGEEGRIQLETEEAEEMDVDAAVAAQAKHLCVECRDQPAVLSCETCTDNFCEVCFQAMHRSGTRAKHTTTPYTDGQQLDKAVSAGSSSQQAAAQAAASNNKEEGAEMEGTEQDGGEEVTDDMLEQQYQQTQQPAAAAAASSSSSHADAATSALSSDSGEDDSDDDNSSRASAHSASASGIILPTSAMNSSLLSSTLPRDWFLERAKYIPVRLTLEERKYLRLLESTLHVSEYTDKIDIISHKDKHQRIKGQLRDICSILSGLLVANDYKEGQKLIKDRDFEQNAEFFQNVFELGRRHKIRNPEKMRNNYGKLMYIVQDSVSPAIQELMGFHLYAPLKTVYRTLSAADALDVLLDERMMLATGDIKTEGRQRPEIERDIKAKNAAVAFLARKYANPAINEEDMRQCILSIADNHTFLLQNRNCCDVMVQWLRECYHPTEPQPPYSLAILGGRNGARLTHSHASQYSYVLQSLTLWREIIHDFFKLWALSEEDLFDSSNPYRLRNTGQGLNRVQSCPRVGKTMHNILHHCQRKLGSWVGSSVVHLGDHNVPSSFMFLDKYTQVSRILNPIVLTIKALPRLCEKQDIRFYIDKVFGGPEKLKMLILTDFFRSAFDGSGADNFFDAGSCIDGRLTSAWNWCSKIEKKSYYSIFQLAGFSSFDGQWSD